jgi:hypothetical protein
MQDIADTRLCMHILIEAEMQVQCEIVEDQINRSWFLRSKRKTGTQSGSSSHVPKKSSDSKKFWLILGTHKVPDLTRTQTILGPDEILYLLLCILLIII